LERKDLLFGPVQSRSERRKADSRGKRRFFQKKFIGDSSFRKKERNRAMVSEGVWGRAQPVSSCTLRGWSTEGRENKMRRIRKEEGKKEHDAREEKESKLLL